MPQSILVFGDSHVGYLEPFLDLNRFHCESYPGWSAERLLSDAEWTLDVALSEDHYDVCVLVAGSNDSSDAEGAEFMDKLRCRVLEMGVKTCWVMTSFHMTGNWIEFPALPFGQEHMTDDEAKSLAEDLSGQLRLDNDR